MATFKPFLGLFVTLLLLGNLSVNAQSRFMSGSYTCDVRARYDIPYIDTFRENGMITREITPLEGEPGTWWYTG